MRPLPETPGFLPTRLVSSMSSGLLWLGIACLSVAGTVHAKTAHKEKAPSRVAVKAEKPASSKHVKMARSSDDDEDDEKDAKTSASRKTSRNADKAKLQVKHGKSAAKAADDEDDEDTPQARKPGKDGKKPALVVKKGKSSARPSSDDDDDEDSKSTTRTARLGKNGKGEKLAHNGRLTKAQKLEAERQAKREAEEEARQQRVAEAARKAREEAEATRQRRVQQLAQEKRRAAQEKVARERELDRMATAALERESQVRVVNSAAASPSGSTAVTATGAGVAAAAVATVALAEKGGSAAQATPAATVTPNAVTGSVTETPKASAVAAMRADAVPAASATVRQTPPAVPAVQPIQTVKLSPPAPVPAYAVGERPTVVRVYAPPRQSYGQVRGLGNDTAGSPLSLNSNVAFVMDQATGEVLINKNGSQVSPIASITKLMTAVVTLDANLPMDEMITITYDDVDNLKGSSSRLAVGTTLTRQEMLHLALMSSENRAAHALGRTYPGGLGEFVRTMNLRAAAFGMRDTHYVEPTGLNSSNQSSARDLALLAKTAYRYPLIRNYTTYPGAEFPVNGHMVRFNNTNRLVHSVDWNIGLQKTGYISEAGRCVVMQSNIDGRNVIIVLLDANGSSRRVEDAEAIRSWVQEHRGRYGSSRVIASAGSRMF